jgi:Protein of unknown function (DUF3306)
MTVPDNFIRRWARLRRASDSAHEIETVSAKVEVTTTQPEAEEAPDQPFDPASLPSLEQIAADADIGAFLKSGVPAELTRAALRRAWASDPAIRDFIGIAENQWDFNDPDGIPGFGPLLATDGGPAVPPLVSSKLESIVEALTELPPSVEPDRSRMTNPEPAPDKSCCTGSGISDSPAKAKEVEAAAKGDGTFEQYEMSGHRRRHGSALPR